MDEVGDGRDLKTTESRPWASFFTEMIDCRADSGGDGLRLYEKEFGLGGRGFLRDFCVCREERCVSLIGLDRLNRNSGRRRGFDHGESGYNGSIGVADLFFESA